MFSETRYARNGDLRVAYRASPEGARDIVFFPTGPRAVKTFRSYRPSEDGSRR